MINIDETPACCFSNIICNFLSSIWDKKIRSFVWRMGGSIAKESTLFGYGTASWVIPGA
jgi:hypothetical protein